MSEESEEDKGLGRASDLRKSLGKPLTALIILFALWTLRKNAGLLAVVTSIGAMLVAGWIKINT